MVKREEVIKELLKTKEEKEQMRQSTINLSQDKLGELIRQGIHEAALKPVKGIRGSAVQCFGCSKRKTLECKNCL